MVKQTTKISENQQRAEDNGWFNVAVQNNGDHLFFNKKHGYIITKGWDDLCATHHSMKEESK